MTTQIYSALEKRIKELATVNVVDWYMEQYLDSDDNLVWNTPAAFLEFAPVNWISGAGGREMWAVMELTVHLVSESAFDDKTRFTGSQHLNFQQQVWEALNQWECDLSYYSGSSEDTDMLINTMTILSSSSDHQLSKFIVTKLVFSAVVYNRYIQFNIDKGTVETPLVPTFTIEKKKYLTER